MKISDKERIDQEYTEAMEELQRLYNDLFYEELKQKIDSASKELQRINHNLTEESQKSTESISGYLNVLREDLNKQVSNRQVETLNNISEWLQHLNKEIQTNFDKQLSITKEQIEKDQERLRLQDQSFKEWRDEITEYLLNNHQSSKKYKEEVIEQVNETRNIIVKSQLEVQDQLQIIKDVQSLQYKHVEDSRKQNALELKEKLKGIKNQLEQDRDLIEETTEKKTKSIKFLIYGVIGIQTLLVIHEAAPYFQ